MIADGSLTLQQFREQFTKSFTAFCHRLPIIVTFGVDDAQVVLLEVHPFTKEQKLILFHPFDYSTGVKQNIHDIKQKLLAFYPTFTVTEKYERSLTSEEILEMDGDPLALMEQKKAECVVTDYRIEKVLLLQDRLIVRNLDTNLLELRKAKMPVSILVKNLRFNLVSEDKGDYFLKKTEVLRTIEERTD